MPQVPVEIAAGTDDGRIQRLGTDWPPTTGGYSRLMTAGSITAQRQRTGTTPNFTYQVRNALLRFNTAAQLPDNAVVVGATLQLTGQNVRSNTDGLFFTWGWPNPVWDGVTNTVDYSYTPETNAHPGISISSLSLTGVQDFVLSNAAANIPVTTSQNGGYAYLRGSISELLASAAPNGNNEWGFWAYENNTSRPVLIVHYTIPTPTPSPTGAPVFFHQGRWYYDTDVASWLYLQNNRVKLDTGASGSRAIVQSGRTLVLVPPYVYVNWNDNAESDFAYYSLERAPDSTGSPGAWTQIATNLTVSEYYDGNVALNDVWWYRVRAYDDAGQASSGYSTPYQVTVAAGGSPQSVALVGVATDELVGTLTLAPGVRTVTLTGVASDELTGTLTPVPGVRTLSLVGVDSDELTGALTPVPGVRALALVGVASDELAGSLTLAPGVAASALIGVATDEQVGSLTPIPAGDTRVLVGVATDEQVGTLTPVPGVSTVTLVGVATDELVGTLTPVPGVRTITLAGVATDEQIGSLTPVPDTRTIALTGVASGEQVGTLTPVGGVGPNQSIALPGYKGDPFPTGEAFPTGEPFPVGVGDYVGTLTPITTAPGTSVLSGVPSDELVGTLTPTPGARTIVLSGVGTDDLTGVLTPVPGVRSVTLTGVSSDELVGSLTPVPGVRAIALTGVSSDELIGTLTPVPGVITVSLSGVSTDEQVGTLTVAQIGSTSGLTGVPSDELVGTLTPVPGVATRTLVGVGSDELVGVLTTLGPSATVALAGLSSDELIGVLQAIILPDWPGTPLLEISIAPKINISISSGTKYNIVPIVAIKSGIGVQIAGKSNISARVADKTTIEPRRG